MRATAETEPAAKSRGSAAPLQTGIRKVAEATGAFRHEGAPPVTGSPRRFSDNDRADAFASRSFASIGTS